MDNAQPIQESFDFVSFMEGSDTNDSPEPVSETVVTKPEVKPSQPIVTATPSVEPVTPPVASAPVEAPVSQPIHPVEQAQPQINESEVASRIIAARAAASDQVAQRFAFTQDEADQILIDPAPVIQKKLAEATLVAFELGMQAIQHSMGDMVNRAITEKYEAVKKLNQFYDMFPLLRGSDETELAKLWNQYYQMNPQAPFGVAAKSVGLMRLAALGLLRPEAKAPVQPPQRPSIPPPPAASSLPAQPGSGNAPENSWANFSV